MTRSQFILAFALLVVSGTIAFAVTFRGQEQQEMATRVEKKTPLLVTRKSSSRTTTRPSQSSDRTSYEVTISEISQRESAGQIERESKTKLEKMSARYELTGNQRRQIYPLLAKYHPLFQEGMVVNGQVLSPPQDSAQLSSEIYPLLTGLQQDGYLSEVLSEDQWWGEIITQLRDDLDGALETGDIIITSDDEE